MSLNFFFFCILCFYWIYLLSFTVDCDENDGIWNLLGKKICCDGIKNYRTKSFIDSFACIITEASFRWRTAVVVASWGFFLSCSNVQIFHQPLLSNYSRNEGGTELPLLSGSSPINTWHELTKVETFSSAELEPCSCEIVQTHRGFAMLGMLINMNTSVMGI